MNWLLRHRQVFRNKGIVNGYTVDGWGGRGHARATMKDPESERLARDNLEINHITVKPETGSHAPVPGSREERGAWTLTLSSPSLVVPSVMASGVAYQDLPTDPGCGSCPLSAYRTLSE